MFNRVFANGQFLRDFAVRTTRGGKVRNLTLARRQCGAVPMWFNRFEPCERGTVRHTFV